MKKLFIFSVVTTVTSLLLSWIAAEVAGLNKEHSYPKSVYLAYTQHQGHRYEIEKTETYAVDQIDELQIDSFAINVKLVKSTTGALEVKLRGFVPDLKETFTHENTGRIAKLKTKEFSGLKTKLTFDFSFKTDSEGELTVGVPAGIRILKIKTSSGDIMLSGLTLNRLMTQTFSGGTSLTNSTVSEYVHSSASGGLTIGQSSVNLIEGKTYSGNMNLALATNSPTLILDTASGDVNLQFRDTPDLDVNFVTSSGNFKLDPDFGKLADWKKEASVRIGSGKSRVRLKTYSGDFKIGKI
jgi:DUF4097 and DUF4098 domain-containing protein YvlB